MIYSIWEKTSIQKKIAVISCFLFSIFSQGMGLFNKYSIHDDLGYIMNGGDPLPYGRWMLYLGRRFERLFYGDGQYSMPVFNGFILIFCIIACLCILIDLIKIQSTTLCFMLGALMVSIPVVTSTMGFMYNAHFYGIALFLSVYGAYLIIKYDKWYIWMIAVGLLSCSVGIYQAYVPVTVCTFLFWLIKNFSEAETSEERKELYKKTLLFCICSLLFMIIYGVILFFFLKRGNVKLAEYKHIDQVPNFTFIDYVNRIPITYKEFFYPKYHDGIFTGNIHVINVMLTIVFVINSVIITINILKKNKISGIVTLLLFILVPPSVLFIYIMTVVDNASPLMLYGWAMLYVIFAWTVEKCTACLSARSARIWKVSGLGIMAVLMIMFIRFDNECYLRIHLTQSQATRYFTTLVTRIQNAQNYNSWQNVCYIGSPNPGRQDNSAEELPEFSHIDMVPYYGFKGAVQDRVWKEYLRIWCGYTAHELAPSYMIGNKEVQEMPRYPDEGSIKVVGDTLVVKF